MHRHIPRRAVPFACLTLTITVLTSTGAHAKPYDDWRTPVAVAAVNGPSSEGCPIESPDGL